MAGEESSESGNGPLNGRGKNGGYGDTSSESLNLGKVYGGGSKIARTIYGIDGNFNTHINPLGERRDIVVSGDDGAYYDLEITDRDGKYYN